MTADPVAGASVLSPRDVGRLTNGSLPSVLTTREVAELTRTTPDMWWRMAREGTAPIPFFRLGSRQIRWPTAPLLAALGLDGDEPTDDVECSEGGDPHC